MSAGISKRIRGAILAGSLLTLALPAASSSADGSYPTVSLPLEVARVPGDPSTGALPFGSDDLSYNMTCQVDGYGNDDIICLGGYLSPSVRVYRRTLTRGYIPTSGLHSSMRIESDSTITEVESVSGTEFHYDVNGRLETIRDPNGRTVTITRDAAGKVTQVEEDASGRSITFAYSGNLITHATFSAGGTITYQYTTTAAGQKLSNVIDLAGEISSWTYDAEGELISSSDSASGTITYEFDQGNIVKDGDGTVLATITIDTSNFAATSSNALGLVSSTSKDYRGLVTSDTTSNGTIRAIEYDAERNPIIVLTNYDTKVMKYADFGIMIQSSHSSFGETTTFQYDTNLRLTGIEHPGGDTEFLTYDTFRNILTHRLRNGGIVSNIYDAQGNRTLTQDPDGVVTVFEYNEMGFVTAQKGCASCGGGPSRYSGYNDFGYLISQGNGFDTTTITVDSVGRQLAVILPGGGQSITAWAAAGPSSVSNSVTGETLTYAYQSGQMASMTDALGAKSEFTYLSSGDLASYKSPLGDLTRYAYDSAASLAGVDFPTNPLGTPQRSYVSDSAGRLVRFVRETGDVLDFTFDAVGRSKERKANAVTVANLTYDSRGYLAQAQDPLGTTAFERNAFGQTTRMNHPSGAVINYAYSDAGRIEGVSLSSHSSSFGYDTYGRLSLLGTEAGSVAFSYDSAGRVSSMTYPNGITAIYSYGSTGATSRVEYRNIGGETVVFVVSRDSMSKITRISRSDLGETRSYSYTRRGEVARAEISRASDTVSFSYQYDSAGNRVTLATNSETTAYDYDPGNLLDSGEIDYSYNLAGEVTAIGSRNLTYTAEGQLKTDSAPGGTVTYSYDAFNRRHRSVVGGTTTWRLWDESENEIADLDGSGNVTEFRYFIPRVMDVIIGFTRGSQTYFTLHDPAGNIAIVVDESGNAVARYGYEPFSLRADIGFDSVSNRFRFAGRREEASGEIYVRARSLDGATGRFLQRDPVFIGDNHHSLSWNGFGYALNDPLQYRDPTGATPYPPPSMTLGNCKGSITSINITKIGGPYGWGQPTYTWQLVSEQYTAYIAIAGVGGTLTLSPTEVERKWLCKGEQEGKQRWLIVASYAGQTITGKRQPCNFPFGPQQFIGAAFKSVPGKGKCGPFPAYSPYAGYTGGIIVWDSEI